MRTSFTAMALVAVVLARSPTAGARRVVAAEASSTATQTGPPGVRWLVFIDDLHLRFVRTGTIRTAVRRLLDGIDAYGDAVAMRSDGPSGLEGKTLIDRPRQLDAITRITGKGLRDDDVVQSWLAPRPPGAGREVIYRATVALTTLRDWLDATVDPRGRTVLVIVSEGVAVAADQLGDAPTLGPPLVRMGPERDAVRTLVAEVIAAAQATQTPVMAFDARDPGLLAADPPPANLAADVDLRTLKRRSLDELASATGGAFVQGPSAVPGAITRLRTSVVR